MNNMPAPVKDAKHCNLEQLPDLVSGRTVKMVSLFEQKRIKGIWPCFSDESGERELTVGGISDSLISFAFSCFNT